MTICLSESVPGHPPLFPELEQLHVLDAVTEQTILVAWRAAMDGLQAVSSRG